MKTRLFSILFFLGMFSFNVNAQVSEPTNAITNTNSYVGTSANKNVNFKRYSIDAGAITATSTSLGVYSYAPTNSVAFGISAGRFSSGVGFNTYVGHNAGKGVSTSNTNSGAHNTFIGYNAGSINSVGYSNTYLGSNAGLSNTSGNNNIAVGYNSGYTTNTGSNNIFIGNNSGCEDQGQFSNCIYVGNYAGFQECASDRLVIDNGETQNPIIWGDLANDRLKFNAKVGIGGNSTTGFGAYPTTAGGVIVSGYNLFVKGGILTEEVRVSLSSTWADYVFNKDYHLKPLSEVEKFINENGHLPNVPSASQVKEEGIELGNMSKIQQEKIEELTLYIIEQNKINEKQAKEIEELKKLVTDLINKK